MIIMDMFIIKRIEKYNEYAFHDDKLVKNRKLSLIEKKIGELTTKDILELSIINLL